MKNTPNFHTRNDLVEVYSRLDVSDPDGNYLFSMLINPEETFIQLPVHLPPGSYFWQFRGSKTEKKGIIQLRGTRRSSIVLEKVAVADL